MEFACISLLYFCSNNFYDRTSFLFPSRGDQSMVFRGNDYHCYRPYVQVIKPRYLYPIFIVKYLVNHETTNISLSRILVKVLYRDRSIRSNSVEKWNYYSKRRVVFEMIEGVRQTGERTRLAHFHRNPGDHFRFHRVYRRQRGRVITRFQIYGGEGRRPAKSRVDAGFGRDNGAQPWVVRHVVLSNFSRHGSTSASILLQPRWNIFADEHFPSPRFLSKYINSVEGKRIRLLNSWSRFEILWRNYK